MSLRVGVLGAGAIGAHVGLRLAAAGADVTLIGRPRLIEARAKGRLEAVTLDHRSVPAPASLTCSTDPAALREVEVCLITVKSHDSESAARQLAEQLPREAIVVSLQNGLRNAEVLRRSGLASALAGMISFNVFVDGDRYRQATSGPILVEDDARARPQLRRLAEAMRAAGLEFELRSDMQAVLAGKLLLNLNNAVCTLAGVSIAASLRSRDLRRCFAASMREGLQIFAGAGVPVATIGRLPPRLIVHLLPLPDAIVLRVAKSLITIDPAARSSTLQDLERGKQTEIDALDGELVRLADERNLPCPIHRFIVEQVHRLERMPKPEFFEPAKLWAEIRARM